MASVRETALSALHTLLEGIGADIAVTRNEYALDEIGAGLIAFGDGEPGEPEVLLSPLTYSWAHRVPVEVYVEGDAAKEAALDALLTRLDAALTADRTLGGTVDWLDFSAPDTAFDRPPGAEDMGAARITVTLEYDSSSPLG